MISAKACVKGLIIVVATLVAIGAWDVYTGTLKLTGQAYAQVTVTASPVLKCYEIAGAPVGEEDETELVGPNETVVLIDQFGTETTKVREPQLLCTPATKCRGPVTAANPCIPVTPNPFQDFKCYQIRGRELNRTGILSDRFHPAPNGELVQVNEPEFLCDPATKTTPP